MTKQLKQITVAMIDVVTDPGIDEDVKQEHIDRWHEDFDSLANLEASSEAMKNSDSPLTSSPQTPHQNGGVTKRQYKVLTTCGETARLMIE